MTPAIRAEQTAGRLSRWALSRASSPNFARAFQVSAARIRHWRTDDPGGHAEKTLHAVLTGDEQVATAIRDAVHAAWEHRVLLSAPTATLLSRWHWLWHHEPEWDAVEDYQAALYMGGQDAGDYDAALLRQGSALLEMVAIRAELEARGVDTRGALTP